MILHVLITIGSHDFVMSSVLSDIPDGVNLTGDDNWNPAFKIAANTKIVTKDISVCSKNRLSQYSLLTKFKLTDMPTKVTLINVTSNEGVELAVSIETETMEVIFECLSLLARFPLRTNSLGAKQWHMMSISVIPTSLSLYLDNKLVHTARIDSSQSCDLSCNSAEVTIGYSPDGVSLYSSVSALPLCEPHPCRCLCSNWYWSH